MFRSVFPKLAERRNARANAKKKANEAFRLNMNKENAKMRLGLSRLKAHNSLLNKAINAARSKQELTKVLEANYRMYHVVNNLNKYLGYNNSNRFHGYNFNRLNNTNNGGNKLRNEYREFKATGNINTNLKKLINLHSRLQSIIKRGLKNKPKYGGTRFA